MVEVVAAHRGHPSVVAWVPLNESWGVQEAEVDHRQRGLIRALAAAADALDGTKPATLETGKQIQVPLFMEQGTRVKVDTRDGSYLGRITG